MAKVTKSVKRPATSSSIKSVGKSRKGLFGRRFNLQSRKVQFVVFILIVAVLGGGYYTYKSFAASWTYSLSNNNLAATPNGSACQAVPYNEPAKGNARVWSITCQPTSALPSSNVEVKTVGSYLPSGYSGNYRFCAYVKGRGKFELYMAGAQKTSFYEINYPDYKYVCTQTQYFSTPRAMDGRVVMQTGATQGGWINVGSIVLEKI